MTYQLSYHGSSHKQVLGKLESENFILIQIFCNLIVYIVDFAGGSDGKASAYNVGDLSSIPGLENLLEKEMATCSSTLAWKIPWLEEPGGLQSIGSQRVRHD